MRTDPRFKQINWEIGGRIASARHKAGLSQMKLAEYIDVNTQFISDVERGLSGVSIKTLRKICNVLEVSSDYILFGWVISDEEDPDLPIYYLIKELPERKKNIVKGILRLLIKLCGM